MILVVTDQMNLSFLLQHQGVFLHCTPSATEALRVLRDSLTNISGVVLDDRLHNSKLVSGYVRTHAPGVKLVSWQMAQRNSPFRIMEEESVLWSADAERSRFVYQPLKRTAGRP